MTDVEGVCDARFARVREVFSESFRVRLALGAAVSVVVGGRTVADLWGGVADAARTRPWQRDTLVNVFSVTKAITSVCLLRLVERGLVDLDAPVARYWPEFAQADKGALRVRWLLDHRAGLPALREPVPNEAIFDWSAMTASLAAEAPWWEPGTRHGYHAITFGWLVGEVIRRVTGDTVGAMIRAEIAGPLGLDLHLGLDEAHDARVAELKSGPRAEGPDPTLFERIMAAPDSMTARAFTNPVALMMPATHASRAWRGAELPAVNAQTNARAVARFFSALTREELLSVDSIARASAQQSSGMDLVLSVPTRFGLGFMLSQPHASFGPNEGAFGHPGAGGSLGFADPSARVGFGYVANRMGSSILVDPRASALIDALYACL